MEKIGKIVVEELKKVKMNAENIETAIDDQSKLLNGLNRRAEKNLGELQEQSADLKEAINKHKSGK